MVVMVTVQMVLVVLVVMVSSVPCIEVMATGRPVTGDRE